MSMLGLNYFHEKIGSADENLVIVLKGGQFSVMLPVIKVIIDDGDRSPSGCLSDFWPHRIWHKKQVYIHRYINYVTTELIIVILNNYKESNKLATKIFTRI